MRERERLTKKKDTLVKDAYACTHAMRSLELVVRAEEHRFLRVSKTRRQYRSSGSRGTGSRSDCTTTTTSSSRCSGCRRHLSSSCCCCCSVGCGGGSVVGRGGASSRSTDTRDDWSGHSQGDRISRGRGLRWLVQCRCYTMLLVMSARSRIVGVKSSSTAGASTTAATSRSA